jgi:hypothetical protein
VVTFGFGQGGNWCCHPPWGLCTRTGRRRKSAGGGGMVNGSLVIGSRVTLHTEAIAVKNGRVWNCKSGR